eukprot:CAMPEP_0172158730 /NCGR_PEP_ID=MMETSP1050-20130122/4547_1 /TAXON_ID=233186 /ORGANISM="Cryptomonas curvata, Strain CCAP979/52" /LENGTH=201 /DNA_ID=CAMNT_0012828179 /DNA_START=42 /DNA_END=643 /DNA_ORIENTATION=+
MKPSIAWSIMKSVGMENAEEEAAEKSVEISAPQNDSENLPQKQRRPGYTIERAGLMSKGKYALDPKLAGASKIHGPALIYRNDRPNEVTALTGISWNRIISGQDHILAQDSQGVIFAWGRGEAGQLGHGKFAHSATPSPIEALADYAISDVCCGAEFSAALTEDGQLFTWGLNRDGQLGHGDTCNVCTPTPVAAMFRLSSR